MISQAAPVVQSAPIIQAGPLNGGHSHGIPLQVGPGNGGGRVIVPVSPSPPPNVMPHPGIGEVKAATKKPAFVVIKASSDVKISVNGQETKRTSASQTFDTPPLVAGKSYAYNVAAEVVREGKTYTTSKRVTVKAGEVSEVDFGDMSAVVAEQRAQTARITVMLPEGGKLLVDGKEQQTKAVMQTFETPKLAKGKSYFYVLRVEMKVGKDVDVQAKRVTVEAGKDTTVDFRSMAALR